VARLWLVDLEEWLAFGHDRPFTEQDLHDTAVDFRSQQDRLDSFDLAGCADGIHHRVDAGGCHLNR
jgi:hypothetical protein